MPVQQFNDLTALGHHVGGLTGSTAPEHLRDLLVLIFHEMAMRRTGSRYEKTGFEGLKHDELHSAFYRVVNEMVHRIPH